VWSCVGVVHSAPISALLGVCLWNEYLPSLETDWKMFRGPSALVVLVEAKVEVSKPLDLFLTIVLSSFGRNNTLKHDASVFMKLISPVIKFHTREIHQVFRLSEPGDGLGFGG
jgi:hypothetical protein